MRYVKALGLAAVGMALVLGVSAHATTRKQDLNNKETFKPEDAVKGLVYVDKAMTTPMMDLLKKADVQHPDYMLEYGLALDLGRESVSQQMSKDDREKLKRGFRAMLDLYINSSDKFDITFDEDAMLDQSEFWIYLAKHVGRPKERVSLNGVAGGESVPGGPPMVFVPDSPDQDKEFNLLNDVILNGNVVNASTACAQSAFGFARMRKAQTVDIAETKLTPEQFATVQATAVKAYRMAYSEGQLACSGLDNFNKIVAFSSQNLGKLGTMKDNPDAKVATVGGDTSPSQ